MTDILDEMRECQRGWQNEADNHGLTNNTEVTMMKAIKEVEKLREVLSAITDAFEARCEGWNEWCGAEDCPKCGSSARLINSARKALTPEQ